MFWKDGFFGNHFDFLCIPPLVRSFVLNRAFPKGVRFEEGKGLCGVSLPSNYNANSLESNDTLAKKSVGLGIGAYWNTLVKSINTYNGKDSPGNTEDPSKEKSKQGKTVIYKRYYDRITNEETIIVNR